MASRRTRIKGIANIPQRKKPSSNELDQVQKESQDPKILDNNENSQNKEVTPQENDETTVKDEECNKALVRFKIVSETVPKEFSNICDNRILSNYEQTKDEQLDNGNAPLKNKIEASGLKPIVVRRKFLKPVININIANKRFFQENKSNATDSLGPHSEKDLFNSINQENLETIIINDVSEVHTSDVVLNETDLFSTEIPLPRTAVVTFSPNVKHIVPDVQNLVSDTEYPVPPCSPNKYNRRIKPVPRLSQRKTSFSASESEDETKRYGRIRNNSVCSVASTSGLDPPTPLSESMTPKENIPTLQKKICRTDQSRKLAEARKEFHKRFGSSNPDKHKLKMIDLIFYNPSTNPMSQQNNNNQAQSVVDNDDIQNENDLDEIAEEGVDDPTKENNSDNSIPVPQIKIGPSGEIILDEKSLIVENAEVVKQKQKMQNSEVVDGNFDTGYGIYTRAARSKDWSQNETLRFYKALNLIGTDFTTMSQLFPKRSRRELKLKFNKEERINRHLIDKAIMQPCNYNFAQLKREIEIEEAEEAAVQKLKEEEIEERKKNKQTKRGRKRKAKDAEPSQQDQTTPLSETIHLDYVHNNGKTNLIKPSVPKKRRLKTLNITNMLQSDSDADVSDLETQSEDEGTALPVLQQTRSGRIPKITQRYTTLEDSLHLDKKSRLSSLSSYPELNSDKLVPGSVVILSEENCEDKYKVYMVTPDRQLTLLDLDQDVISDIIKERQQSGDGEEILLNQNCENNITIPATTDTINQTENETTTETGTYLLL